jgi:hypothetical protein
MRKIGAVQLKNKATCVAFSWMRAWGIDVRLPESPTEGDLVVGGRRIVIQEDRRPGEFDFALSPTAVMGQSVSETLAELHRLTEFLGKGKPQGFRKVSGKERAKSEDYLGVSMRLTPFGRTPNIPEADMKPWLPVLKREADRAARRCAKLLGSMGLERGDLYTIGLVFLQNYLARHQEMGNEKVTGANLTLYLIQQYGRWADVTIRHLKNVSVVSSGLPLNLLVGTPHPGAQVEEGVRHVYGDDEGEGPESVMSYEMSFEETPSTEDDQPLTFASAEEREKWERKKAMQDGRYAAKRRRNAKAALEAGLSEMPHDRMVYVLQEVRDSNFHHPDAREEAHRRLTAHTTGCQTCQGHR